MQRSTFLEPPVAPFQMLSVNELTRRLGVSRTTLYSWRRQGEFPKAVRLGPNRLAWKSTDVEKFLEERRVA